MASLADQAVTAGLALHRAGQCDAAERQYRAVLDREPDHAEALHWLGVIALQRGDQSQALSLLVRSLERKPDSAPALNNLGNLLIEMGWEEQALTFFDSALVLAPDFVEIYYNKARAHRRLGQGAAAIAAYQQALARQPAYLEAAYQLGSLWAEQGEHARAEACFRTVLALDPEDRAGAKLALAALGVEATPAAAEPAFVRALFDRYAPDFDAHLSGRLAYRAPQLLAEALLPYWQDLESGAQGQIQALDLGCGTGLAGASVRDRVARLDGIDLSPRMIEQARKRGIYDALWVGDLLPVMAGFERRYDIVLAADVLVYFGDLTPLFCAMAAVLTASGVIAVTVEAAAGDSSVGEAIQVHEGLRFVHSEPHIRAAVARAGLSLITLSPCAIRCEADRPVPGYVAVARRKTEEQAGDNAKRDLA